MEITLQIPLANLTRGFALPMSSSIVINPVPMFAVVNTMAVEHRENLRLRWAVELVAELVARISYVQKSIA